MSSLFLVGTSYCSPSAKAFILHLIAKCLHPISLAFNFRTENFQLYSSIYFTRVFLKSNLTSFRHVAFNTFIFRFSPTVTFFVPNNVTFVTYLSLIVQTDSDPASKLNMVTYINEQIIPWFPVEGLDGYFHTIFK